MAGFHGTAGAALSSAAIPATPFADSMYETECFVGGEIAELGNDAVVEDAGRERARFSERRYPETPGRSPGRQVIQEGGGRTQTLEFRQGTSAPSWREAFVTLNGEIRRRIAGGPRPGSAFHNPNRATMVEDQNGSFPSGCRPAVRSRPPSSKTSRSRPNWAVIGSVGFGTLRERRWAHVRRSDLHSLHADANSAWKDTASAARRKTVPRRSLRRKSPSCWIRPS